MNIRARAGFILALVVSAGCSSKTSTQSMPPAPQPDAGTAAITPYDAWREMQDVLRKSPDHLPGRAAALVANHDVDGLFRLVRDDVGLLPTTENTFDDAANRIRWGARATLRGAAGTPRERAELLRLLFERAGFSAQVVSGALEPGVDLRVLLVKPSERHLVWNVSDETVRRWTAAQGEPVTPRGGFATQLDPDFAVRDAILSAIRPLLATPAPTGPMDTSASAVPLVKVTVNGQVRFANPNVAGANLGESHTTSEPMPAEPVTGERSLKLTLAAARSDRPGTTFPLLSKQFAASDVAGRTITVEFPTPSNYDAAQKRHVGDASVFIPVMVVRGDGLDEQGSRALSVVGTPVTLDGETIAIEADGLSIDGKRVRAGPTPPSRIAEVRSMSAIARAGAFPSIELIVSARARDGSTVPGLASDAFRVEEEGHEVAAQLRRTDAPPTRLVMLFDTEFVDIARRAGHSIASRVLAAIPDAQIRVAGLSTFEPEFAGDFTASLAEIDRQLGVLNGLYSEVWGNLAAVAKDPIVTATLLLSDVDSDDAPTPDFLSRINRGPPVIVAGVGTVVTATAARIAEITNGLFLTDGTAIDLADRITAFLKERRAFDYRLVYRANQSGPATRHAVVKLTGTSTIVAAASYEVSGSPIGRAGLSALFLTIETEGGSVTRTLAGSEAGSAEDQEAVNGALFGRFTLAVEAHEPGLSILLDEHIGERTALEDRYKALAGGAPDAILAASKRGFFRVPTDLRFSTAPLHGEVSADGVTFTDGLEVTLHSTLPKLGHSVSRKLDFVPLVPRRTLRPAGGDAFTATLVGSADLAVFEDLRFQSSTWSLLRGKQLGRFDPGTVDIMLGPAWRAPVVPYSAYEIIAPVAGTPVAFFAVHAETGALIGGMSDGSGGGWGQSRRGLGGDESTEQLVDRLLTELDAAKRAGTLLGYEGVSAWADLEATKVQLLGDVIILFEGSSSGGNPSTNTQRDLCAAGLEQLGEHLPGFDLVSRPFNDLQALYRAIRVFTGAETPNIPGLDGPAATACAALFPGG